MEVEVEAWQEKSVLAKMRKVEGGGERSRKVPENEAGARYPAQAVSDLGNRFRTTCRCAF